MIRALVPVARCLLFLFVNTLSLPIVAHEVRPAYLEMHETSTGAFRVLWKTPMRGNARLALVPEFSGITETTSVLSYAAGGAAVQTWTLRTPALRGQILRIRGLEATMTDTLVRVEFSDGTSWTQRLTARTPEAPIPLGKSTWALSNTYFWLGVEHILTGLDHLLFVLALMIITRGGGKLVTTITAFTIAHSITLGVATLGFVHAPPKPVEAVIALSIAFVAAEIVRGVQGHEGITARMPWIVAFTFGLLHGFGFAGSLSEVGLPEGRIPLALLFFNIGVEAGQLLFVGVVICGIALARPILSTIPRWGQFAPAYTMGTVGMFWVIQRVSAF